jgi:hypothetical protein
LQAAVKVEGALQPRDRLIMAAVVVLAVMENT